MDGTVLIADDDRTIRTVLTQAFTRAGCKVHATSSMQTLMIWVEEGKGDLVISDVRMPDANGYEVFRATKDVNPETPVILMTAFGYDPNHSIVRSSQEGLHCFLFKPFQISQLLEEARKALHERSTKLG